MDQAEKTRLQKLLGMLGSSFEGERATAAMMIQRMAEGRKLTINELIAEALAPSITPPQQPPPPPDNGPDFTDIDGGYLERLRILMQHPEVATRILTPWEMQFVVNVSSRYQRDYELSEKQLGVAEKIIRKVNRASR